jgi:hypothetical protein
MGMRRWWSLAVVAVSLTACEREPRISDAPPPGISYRYKDDITDARQRAEQYCQQYGKRAHLQSINQSGADHIAVYDCT